MVASGIVLQPIVAPSADYLRSVIGTTGSLFGLYGIAVGLLLQMQHEGQYIKRELSAELPELRLAANDDTLPEDFRFRPSVQKIAFGHVAALS